MRPPGEIRAELDGCYRRAKALLRELPGECHRTPDTDIFEALRRWRDGEAAPERTEDNHGRDDG